MFSSTTSSLLASHDFHYDSICSTNIAQIDIAAKLGVTYMKFGLMFHCPGVLVLACQSSAAKTRSRGQIVYGPQGQRGLQTPNTSQSGGLSKVKF